MICERLDIQVQYELGNPTTAMSFVVHLNVLNKLTLPKEKKAHYSLQPCKMMNFKSSSRSGGETKIKA
jgi:hypothetical protein